VNSRIDHLSQGSRAAGREAGAAAILRDDRVRPRMSKLHGDSGHPTGIQGGGAQRSSIIRERHDSSGRSRRTRNCGTERHRVPHQRWIERRAQRRPGRGQADRLSERRTAASERGIARIGSDDDMRPFARHQLATRAIPLSVGIVLLTQQSAIPFPF